MVQTYLWRELPRSKQIQFTEYSEKISVNRIWFIQLTFVKFPEYHNSDRLLLFRVFSENTEIISGENCVVKFLWIDFYETQITHEVHVGDIL